MPEQSTIRLGGVTYNFKDEVGRGMAIAPTIVVTAPTGSTVTCSNGNTTMTAQENNGTWTFEVNAYGTWTVGGSLGSDTSAVEVVVDEVNTYEVEINYIPTLGTFMEGQVISLNENGVPAEFYVAQHGYPSAGNGRTLLVRKYVYDQRQWHTSNVNAYATSAIDAWLNGDYYNLLAANVRGKIAEVSIPYTPGNGNTTVGTLSRKVFLLSLSEFGLVGANSNSEGSALPIAGTLKIAKTSAGSEVDQYTRSTPKNSTSNVYVITKYGNSAVDNCSRAYFFSPAFTLPSNFTDYIA